MGPPKGCIDDLAHLSDLDEQMILKELKERYERDVIYTYIGDILVSVNPYKELNIYGDAIGKKYAHIKEFKDLSPHMYAMATKTLQNAQRNRANQCLLVSGESGAGKTEGSKMLVAQIVRLTNDSGFSNLHQKIVEVNPLLEAFGNAETVMNRNSSRFGKLIELIISPDGDIAGAKITEHMLEKSRVVNRWQGERTFHIFYCLFAGLSLNEKQRYYLNVPESYRIIEEGYGKQVFRSGLDYESYELRMEELRNIFNVVGFSSQEVDLILGLVAGILHLCNIDFVAEPEIDQVIIVNEDEIDYASTLLSLQPEDLATVLLSNRAFVRGERIVTLKTVGQACDGRDALAKVLYSHLFSWIVAQINIELDPNVDRRNNRSVGTIGILDMAGFENFPVNSLEQLCINTANEQLQNFFNEYIFAWELREYQGEGIKSPKVKFENNRDVLDLLLRRPEGIFAILEDECRLQTSTDQSYVDKLDQCLGKHSHYKKSKAREPVFTISHFAGLVKYNVQGVVEKNRETLSPNFTSLMENSQNMLIAKMFSIQMTESGRFDPQVALNGDHSWSAPEWSLPHRPDFGPGDSLSRQVGRRLKERASRERQQQMTGPPKNTTSAHFRVSLAELVEKLTSAEPHFIRCLKPNANQSPDNFDSKLIMAQLRSTGVLETTRIRKQGFPTRLPHHIFVERYKILGFPATAVIEPSFMRNACLHILKATDVRDCELGNTKVFLRYWQTDKLNLCLDVMMEELVTLQSVIRTFLARQRFLAIRKQHHNNQEMLANFGDFLSHENFKVFHMMVSSDDHDKLNYQTQVEEAQRREREIQEARRREREFQEAHRREREIREAPPTPHNLGFSGYYDHLEEDYDSPSPDYYNDSRSKQTPDHQVQFQGRHIPDVQGQRGQSSGFLYQNHLNQLLQKWGELDPDIWCKILYMEYDRPVAKFYILDREVKIDMSYEEFDGERIGLGVFRNSRRDAVTEEYRSYIGKGLKLRRDDDGSILATRIGKNDLVVKDWFDPANHCFSGDVLKHNGHLPLGEAVKVFDMEELKSQMGIKLKQGCYNEHISLLQHQSIVGISFVKDEKEIVTTPCWLLIINVTALARLKDPSVKNQVQQKLAEMTVLQKEDAMEEEKRRKEAETRHKTREWSKRNMRQGVIGLDAPLRKTRLDLRQKGEKINEHMLYSWDEQNFVGKEKHINLSGLQDDYEEVESMFGGPRRSTRQGARGTFSSGSSLYPGKSPARKNWAKIKSAIKEEQGKDDEEEIKAKMDRY
ncbi:LOW QUALITY PROTEIN: myosin-IIIb-like [Pecten maximus]|uniref:LOW QUALITY PROTEIN: myosin-IIIb-like n=1 Tax=Pecten maximus TaxID=6579 RepID=UPI001458B92B|nr:LOW QUALITY PROTEIN: myosin-IIIb-like [Pecten maximus]